MTSRQASQTQSPDCNAVRRRSMHSLPADKCRANKEQTEQGVTWTGSGIFTQKSRQNTPTTFTAVPQKHYLDKMFCLHLEKKGSWAKTGSDMSRPGHYRDNGEQTERKTERMGEHPLDGKSSGAGRKLFNPLTCDSSSNHQGALTRIICTRSSKKKNSSWSCTLL